jgi:hypothetical protein
VAAGRVLGEAIPAGTIIRPIIARHGLCCVVSGVEWTSGEVNLQSFPCHGILARDGTFSMSLRANSLFRISTVDELLAG